MSIKVDLDNVKLSEIDNALNAIEHEINNYCEKVNENPAKSFGKIKMKSDTNEIFECSILNDL